MSDEQENVESGEETPAPFVLTDELRKKALEKPKFNILYIGDGDSYLAPFRGESVIKTFSNFYARHANIRYFMTDSNWLTNLKVSDLENVNVLWLDNISNFSAARNLSDILDQLTETIDPGWRNKINKMVADNKDEAEKYATVLRKKRQEKLRIVYALDEFIWEGLVGRVHTIQTVQLMESYMNMADTVVVPTGELREVLSMYQFVNSAVEVVVIPTSINADFFPLFKNFTKKGKAELLQLRDKPKVLIKGLAIPANIEEFIIENYKKMDITICSIDDMNDHVKSLIAKGRVTHIHHWANPFVNRSNIMLTYAIERDAGFDFVIHTKPDNFKGKLYEITAGEADILFSIAYGAIPIVGSEHLGAEDNTNSLLKSSGLTFGKDTSHKKLTQIINLHQSPPMFNEIFGRCRHKAEQYITASPFIMARYFGALLGNELSQARSIVAKEKQEEIEKQEQQKRETDISKPRVDIRKQNEESVEKPTNIIEADFSKSKQ